MRRVRLKFSLCLLAWSIVVFSGCGNEIRPSNPDTTEKRQAILILLDAARPDHFSCYGYYRQTTPNIDFLAKRGILFRNHFTQGTDTRTAIPTLLFSRYLTLPIFPASDAVPLSEPANLFRRLDDECISLPKALSEDGFLTAAISAHTWLREGTPFADEFDEMHGPSLLLKTGGAYPPADQVVDYMMNWMERNREKSYFLYVHIMDTHFPHIFGEDAEYFFGSSPYEGERLLRSGVPKNRNRSLSGEDRRYLDALYDGSLRFTDRQIGRLVKYLKSSRQLDSTMLVITADHGEHLLDQPGRFGHGGPWYDAVGRIPLIVCYPRLLKPSIVDDLTEGIDVFPTILSLLDVDLPAEKATDGVDLSDASAESSPPRDHVFINHGVRNRTDKLLLLTGLWSVLSVSRPSIADLRGELYDIDSDPNEIQDLWASKSDIARSMISIYRRKMMPLHRRYSNAKTDEQPNASFAIAAKDFRTGTDVAVVSGDLPKEYCGRKETSNGWLISKHWAKYWLLASGEARPLSIQIPIPNGAYEVSVSLMGSCAIKIAESRGFAELNGPPFACTEDMEFEEVEIGPVEVTAELFRATIAPHTREEPLIIKLFGFQPIGAREGEISLDDEGIERLKALGYLD